MSKTPCECPLAGYCNKHSVHKNTHLHTLCKTNIRYYNLWEKCKGPLQKFAECIKSKDRQQKANSADKNLDGEAKKDHELPSFIQQAKNLMKSTAEHLRDGKREVSNEQHIERLNICESCEFMRQDRRCAKCGCFLDTKTKWRTSSCPIGKW